MSAEIYYVKSPSTGNVYQVDATKRTNMKAQGYEDVTDEHRARPAAQPAVRRQPQPAPALSPSPPAEAPQTATEGRTA